MNHPIPSASSLARALACPASNVLPRDPDPGSPDADRGTALHAFAESLGLGTAREAALAAVPEAWRETAEGIDLDAILDAAGRDLFGDQAVTFEDAFAWDPATGQARSLGCGLSRDYSAAREGEAVGTADVVLFDRAAGCVRVMDYKFGHGDVERAARNAQIRALCLYAARRYQAPRAIGIVVRLREDGTAWLDRAEFTPEDLDGISDELRSLAASIARWLAHPASAEPATGQHCRYCRSAAHCPEGPLALAVRDGSGLERLASTPEGRARLLAMQVFAKRLPEMIDGTLRECIASGAVDLPDGHKLALAEKAGRPRLAEGEDVHRALVGLLGAAGAEQAVPLVRHATLGAIDKAAKASRGAGEKADAAAKRVRGALAEAGLLETPKSDEVVVV